MEEEDVIETTQGTRQTIPIGKRYRMYSDGLQWVLEKHITRHNKEGEPYEVWDKDGYYPSLKWLAPAVLERQLKDADVSEFKSLVWVVDEARREILEAIKTTQDR